MGGTSGVVTRVLGNTIVPDLAADRYGSCSMFVDMANLATKPSSRDDGLVAILAISTRGDETLYIITGEDDRRVPECFSLTSMGTTHPVTCE